MSTVQKAFSTLSFHSANCHINGKTWDTSSLMPPGHSSQSSSSLMQGWRISSTCLLLTFSAHPPTVRSPLTVGNKRATRQRTWKDEHFLVMSHTLLEYTDITTSLRQLRQKGYILAHKSIVRHVGEDMAAGTWGSWSPCIWGQEAERWMLVLS